MNVQNWWDRRSGKHWRVRFGERWVFRLGRNDGFRCRHVTGRFFRERGAVAGPGVSRHGQ